VLPPIDEDFRQALTEDGQGGAAWSGLLRRTARALVEQKQRPAVLALASQCWQLDDKVTADDLVAVALDGLGEKERRPMRLAALEFYWHTGQFARADGLLTELLRDPELARRAGLWHLGARLAEKRQRPARELECLERALDAEFHDLPEVVNLKAVRAGYEKLLSRYQTLAESLATLRQAPPAGFRAKVVRAADRWRALDRDSGDACRMAAQVLRALGEDRELVWGYLTTPVALRPHEAGPWSGIAGQMQQSGEAELADRAFRAAFEAEPTNPQLLWDRARHLGQAGQTARARALYRQLAEGSWQPRFAWLQAQARRELEKR
jgi:tetratricopeptide (TPR) repeat protein